MMNNYKKLFLTTLFLLTSHSGFASNNLVKEVKTVQAKLKYSHYKLGGDVFNLKKGVFLIDCSSYVTNLLQRSVPNAYQQITAYTHTNRPTAMAYYNYFQHLTKDDNSDNWQNVAKVKELKPGDIIAFRYRHKGHRATGHVMVVMKSPKPTKNKKGYVVRIADSTPYHHSSDTRKHHGGVGVGNLVLYANDEGKPISYSWAKGLSPSNKMLINMGRPIEA